MITEESILYIPENKSHYTVKKYIKKKAKNKTENWYRLLPVEQRQFAYEINMNEEDLSSYIRREIIIIK